MIYNNDANAASLYAHHAHFGADADRRSSVSADRRDRPGRRRGRGRPGGRGAAGMAGELGHIRIPTEGLLEPGQPIPGATAACPPTARASPRCRGSSQPAALLAQPLPRPRAGPGGVGARRGQDGAQLRRGGDPLAREIFRQQAIAIGRLFTVAANFSDPDTYFLGGGVVEAAPEFRDWFLAEVREHTVLREEQASIETSLVPDLDMAGARGSAYRRPRLAHRSGVTGHARRIFIRGTAG